MDSFFGDDFYQPWNDANGLDFYEPRNFEMDWGLDDKGFDLAEGLPGETEIHPQPLTELDNGAGYSLKIEPASKPKPASPKAIPTG